jgi:hypothetical protein
MHVDPDLASSGTGRAVDAAIQGHPAPVVVVHSGSRQAASWVTVVLLAVIATALVMRLDEGRLMRSAMAQTESPGAGLVGARGIYAFSGQLTLKTFGLFMLDVDTGTIWCYELSRGTNDELLLRLVAARNWTSDRYLEEFNVADPVPGAVRMMVQQQRAMRQTQVETPAATAPAKGPALP